MIEIKSLTKKYGQQIALNNLNLQLQQGRVIGLFGENGCGKTTLLKTLAGLALPSTGTVQVHGFTPGAASKNIVSYLPDQPNFRSGQKVAQLLEYYQDFFTDFNSAHCLQMLQGFEIDQAQKISSLSKGQREKVQVALTMARQARVYLLDEPISGVDPLARDTVLRTIVAAMQPEATLIIATHLIAEVEPLLDDVILLRHGQLLLTEEAESIRARSGKSLNEFFKEVYA